MLDFHFHSVGDMRELLSLRDYIIKQGLRYPQYRRWVEEACIPDIEHGWKNAILVTSEGRTVGNIIYQPHKQLPRTREVKNMRIHESARRRDVAHFLMRQVEEEDKGTFNQILLDAQELATIEFLQFCGYRPIARIPLYSPDTIDTVMVKEIAPKSHRSPLHS